MKKMNLPLNYISSIVVISNIKTEKHEISSRHYLQLATY